MPRNATSYGRYQVAEPPSALLGLHFHDGIAKLKTVDHEPKVGVLDQEDLLAQGIYVDHLIPGAKRVDALGSCTANATTAALSNLLAEKAFAAFVAAGAREYAELKPYTDVIAAEKAAISFYHACTDQTGNPGQEWPPTDCGSSGPYIVSELQRQKLASGCKIAHGADNLVSLLQSGCLIVGQPFLNSFEEPNAGGFIDGNGTIADIQAAIRSGVAGGHETVISAVEKLALLPTGHVDPFNTVLRFRNSWSRSWGDEGSYRAHLSTYVALGNYCDFRLLLA